MEIIKESFSKYVTEEDLKAALRRVSLMVCLPCPDGLDMPEDHYLCYTSVPNRNKGHFRDLTYCYVNQHFFKPECKDYEKVLKDECRLSFFENTSKTKTIRKCTRRPPTSTPTLIATTSVYTTIRYPRHHQRMDFGSDDT